MTATELDFGSDFLDHSTRASGSGFLKNWKEDGRIIVWINPASPIYSLWGHSWHRYSDEVDKETDEEYTTIRHMRLNCFESEKLLKKQNFRNDDDTREFPPIICPECLSVEWVRAQIAAGKLEWSKPLFRFATEGDHGEDVTIFAGGYCGLFQKKKMTKAEEAQVRKTGVKLSEAFMQNGMPRQQYVLAVASDSDIEAGWMIAFEGKTLGDKLKKCIRDEIKRFGGDVEKGHPKFNPYPFEFSYDENKEFSEKYDVVALSRIAPNEKVQALLDSEDVPDFSKIIEPPKLGSLRDSMKEACLVKGMPIDSFFEKAIETYGEEYESSDEEDGSTEADSERTPEVGGDYSAEEVEGPEEVGGETGCDVCDHPLGDNDMDCPECGAHYEADDDGNVYLATRQCGNDDCIERAVPVDDEGGGVCPQCGGVHDADWNCKVPEKPKGGGGKKTGKRAPRKPAAGKAAAGKAAPDHSDARPSRRSKARAALSG